MVTSYFVKPEVGKSRGLLLTMVGTLRWLAHLQWAPVKGRRAARADFGRNVSASRFNYSFWEFEEINKGLSGEICDVWEPPSAGRFIKLSTCTAGGVLACNTYFENSGRKHQ